MHTALLPILVQIQNYLVVTTRNDVPQGKECINCEHESASSCVSCEKRGHKTYGLTEQLREVEPLLKKARPDQSMWSEERETASSPPDIDLNNYSQLKW